LYQRHLREAGARVSMSRKGNCWDNAVVESFFDTLKEELKPAHWVDFEHCQKEIRAWIHHTYNSVRLHSHNAYLSPDQHEQAWRCHHETLAA
jgi:putative transposase